MGIWAESAKTLMFNNSMLRGKTLFKTLNENSRYNSFRSKIDPIKMNFGLNLVQKRENSRALILFILVYPLLLLFLILWILESI